MIGASLEFVPFCTVLGKRHLCQTSCGVSVGSSGVWWYQDRRTHATNLESIGVVVSEKWSVEVSSKWPKLDPWWVVKLEWAWFVKEGGVFDSLAGVWQSGDSLSGVRTIGFAGQLLASLEQREHGPFRVLGKWPRVRVLGSSLFGVPFEKICP